MAEHRITHDAAAVKAVSQTLTPKLTNAVAQQHANAIRLSRPVPATVFMQIQEHVMNELGIAISAATNNSVGPHPLTNGYKDVAIALTEKRMKGFSIRIVGPSAAELCSGKYHHSCIGCFDARDSGRINDARRALTKRMSKNSTKDGLYNSYTKILNVIQTGEGSSIACSRSATLCNANAEFLYLPHSIYDIHPEEIEFIMYNSNIRTAYAIILCPLALEAGRLEGTEGEVSWETYDANDQRRLIYDEVKEGDYLRMAFNDRTAGYTHKMSTLGTWLWASGYQGKHLNFFFERTRVGNQVIIRINASKLTVSTHHIRGAKYSRTVIPDAKYMMLMTGLSKVIPSQPYHDISTKLYQKIMHHGLSRNGKTFDYNSFVQYCRSNMTTILVGGDQVFGFSRSDVEELSEDCILSLFVLCTSKRMETRDIIDSHREAVEKLIKTGHIRSGFFTDIGHSIQDLFSYTSAIITTIRDSFDEVMCKTMLGMAKNFDAANQIFGFETKTLETLNSHGITNDNEFHTYLRKHNKNVKMPNSWYAPSFVPSFRMRHILQGQDRKLLLNNVLERKFIWETFEAPSMTGIARYRETRYPVRLAPVAPEISAVDGTPLEALIDKFKQDSINEYVTVIATAEGNLARQAKRNGALPAEEQRLANLMEENADYVTKREIKYNGPVLLISAGPGCGKTHKIVTQCRAGDLILTASRAAMDEVNKKIAQRIVDDTKEGNPPPVDVHTYTPHLGMNYAIQCRSKAATCEVGTLWVDEAFLQHPGHALCVASIIGARRVVIVGDYRQISVKDFEIGKGNKIVTQNRWNQLVGFIEEEELLDNYRLPPAIVEALNVRFGYRMIAKSKKPGSFTYNKFKNIADLPSRIDKNAKTVTFLQAHKAFLNAHGVDTSTCHEVQGPTYASVNFVLAGEMCEKFNEDPGYLIVGLSRATDDLHVWVQESDYAMMQLPQSCAGDIDALMDLSRPLTPCTVPVIQPRQINTMLIEDVNIHRPRTNNTDPNLVDQILQDFGQVTIDGGDWSNFHVAYPVNNPTPAPKVRIYTNTVDDLPETVTYSRLTKSNLLQYQENSNIAFKLRTWLARNAGSRRLVRTPLARKIAKQIFDDMKSIFYKDGISKLTSEQLNEGLVTFWHNIQERSKCPRYAEIVGDLFDLGFVEGFVKQQVKGQWSPTDDNAFQVLSEAVRNYKPAPSVAGKAGQGVAAWSKARNVLMAAWISAIEKSTHKLLHPYFIHATDMSDEDLLLHLTDTMQTYGFVMAFKGDDVVLGWVRSDGRWVFHETDQSKFDASFSAIHYSLEAERYRAFGMPDHLIMSNEKHSTRYSINENSNLLRIIDIMCGNCSGKPQTLSLNSFISMCIASQMYEWDCGGKTPVVKFSGQRQTATEKLFGVEIKHASGDVGSFVGFLLTAGTALPDIFRAVVKTVTRRIFTQGTIDKVTAMQLRDEGWAEHELFVAKCVLEQAEALHSRFSGIKTESVREACIMANLKYYYPNCANHTAFYRRVESLLDFVLSYADHDFTRRFVKLYLDNVEEMRIYYVNNDAGADNEYTFITDEEAENIIHMLNIKEKNFVEELVCNAALEENQNDQLEEENPLVAKTIVNLNPFKQTAVSYDLPIMHRIPTTINGETIEPVNISKIKLKALGITRAEYNFLQALHHFLDLDYIAVRNLIHSRATKQQRQARKKLDLHRPQTVAAYYGDILKLRLAVIVDDGTLCSTTSDVDLIDVTIDARGHYVLREKTAPAQITKPITVPPAARLARTRAYQPSDSEKKKIRGDKINLVDFFTPFYLEPNKSSLHGDVSISDGRKMARLCKDLADFACNFHHLVILRDGDKWSIHGTGNYDRIFLCLFEGDYYLLIDDPDPSWRRTNVPPAAVPAEIGILLEDSTYQPTAAQIAARNMVVTQRTPASCFYAAAAAAFKRQLGVERIDEDEIRSTLAEFACDASKKIINDPREMAPFNAVELLCKAYSVCVIERRPDHWYFTGDPTKPKIMLNLRARHWSPIDIDTLTLEIHDSTLDPPATCDDLIAPTPDVTVQTHDTTPDTLSTHDDLTTPTLDTTIEHEMNSTDLDLYMRAKFEKTPEAELAAGYHCPILNKNVNRLRSVLGELIPMLKTGNLTVTVAGDYAHGITKMLAGYDGVNIINDYTGEAGGQKVFSWSRDLFHSKTFLPCDLAILHYRKLSTLAYQTFAPHARIIITFVDMRDEISDHLDNFGGYFIPIAARLTSTKVYHFNDRPGVPGPLVRKRIRNIWHDLIPQNVPHYTNVRTRQEPFTNDLQRILYLDVATENSVRERCEQWAAAGFTAISDTQTNAPVHIDFATRTITYNEAALEIEHVHPEIIGDHRNFSIFRYLGQEFRVLLPGEYRPGFDSEWSQSAAEEGGPEGVPLPFYLQRLRASEGDAAAARLLIEHCGCEIYHEQRLQPTTGDKDDPDRAGQRTDRESDASLRKTAGDT